MPETNWNKCRHSNVRTEDGVVHCHDCGHQLRLATKQDTLDEIASLVAGRIADRLAEHRDRPEPWIGAAAAAEHLSCKLHRIYDLSGQREQNGFPVRHEGNRLLFRRSDLDAWLERRNAA